MRLSLYSLSPVIGICTVLEVGWTVIYVKVADWKVF